MTVVGRISILLVGLMPWFGGGEAGVLRPEGSPSPQIIKTASNPSSGPKAWLGVTLEPAESTEEVGGTTLNGARVGGVVKDGPADRGGIRNQDLILNLDGQAVTSTQDLIRQVGEHVPDTWVQLEVLRRGERRTLQVKLENPPSTQRYREIKRGWVGVIPVDIPKQLKEFWGGAEDSGVLTGEVTPQGPADVAGLQPGDLILEIDGEKVGSSVELIQRIQKLGPGVKAEFHISRQGTVMDLDIELIEPPPPPND